MRMTNEDMNRFVKELAHKIKTGKTGEPSSSPNRVWDVSESDFNLLQAKLHEELYAPKKDTSIDFQDWLKKNK